MADVIYVIMRWLHIASVATLIGGMISGRMVLSQAAEGLSADARESFMDRAAALYRPLWTTTIRTSTDFLIALVAFVLLIRFRVQPWIVVLGVSLASILVALR